jgi:hypothetical protein
MLTQETIRSSWAAPLILLTFLLSLAVLPQPVHAAQGNQGLQGGWAIDNSGNISFTHSLSNQYGSIQQAGAGWVRINFRLGSCFADWTSVGCNGKTALQTYDQVVANAVSHNLKVLGLLSNESWPGTQADWTANNAEHTGGNGDNAYVDSFAQSAASVLALHFNQTSTTPISQWEVWNEPNAWTSNPSPGVYTGGTFIYPSNFAWLLKNSYAAIKNANPTPVVISGGLYAHNTSSSPSTYSASSLAAQDPNRRKHGSYAGAGSTSCSSSVATSGASYLCSMYSEGIANAGWATPYPFDEVGQHLYIDQFGRTSSNHITSYLQDLRNAYLTYEGTTTSKQTHVTEVGWSTANVSNSVQAQNLQTAYTTFRSTSYVGRAYWFSIQDVPEASLYYGLVNTNGVQKRSFAAYQKYATY